MMFDVTDEVNVRTVNLISLASISLSTRVICVHSLQNSLAVFVELFTDVNGCRNWHVVRFNILAGFSKAYIIRK